MIKDWPACANIVNQSIRGRLGIIGILWRYLQIRNRATLGSEDPRIPDQQVCPFRPVGSARAPCTLKYNLWTEIQRGLARQKTPTEFNWYSNIELILNCRCMSRILSTDVHSLRLPRPIRLTSSKLMCKSGGHWIMVDIIVELQTGTLGQKRVS